MATSLAGSWRKQNTGKGGHEEGESGRGQVREEFVVYRKDLLLHSKRSGEIEDLKGPGNQEGLPGGGAP